MSQLNGSKQQSICGDSQCPGASCQGCQAFRESEEIHASIQCPHKAPSCCAGKPCDMCKATANSLVDKSKGAVGGGKARDVVPLQNVNEVCLDCQMNPDPACAVCEMIKSTQEKPPFTKEQVAILHSNLGNIFAKLPKGRRFNRPVRFDIVHVGTINWCSHNCAFASFVQMLSNSNAGLNSINQQKFAGYLLAVIANSLQENGMCDTLLIEAFRLELTILSGNPAWSNWSELTVFGELYSFCVKQEIIIANDFIFVPPNDDGSSYDIGQVLDGKDGFAVIEAQKWVPSIEDLSDGIFSMNRDSKFRISSVVLFSNDHFSIVIISKGIWNIDGKGRMTGEFTAESTMRKLLSGEFQMLCRECGAFYFLEQVPFKYENLILSGSQGLPPRSILYANNPYFLYENGTLFCEESRKFMSLERPIFVSELDGKHVRVFPPPPLPPAPCASGPWFPPPPPLPPCAQVAPALPPPPPFQQASCAQVGWVPQSPLPPVCGAQVAWALSPPPPPPPCAQIGWALPPPPPPFQQASCAQDANVLKNRSSTIVTVNDINVGQTQWKCSIYPEYNGRVEKMPHPNFPQVMMEVYFYETVSYTTLDKLVDFINFVKSIQ